MSGSVSLKLGNARGRRARVKEEHALRNSARRPARITARNDRPSVLYVWHRAQSHRVFFAAPNFTPAAYPLAVDLRKSGNASEIGKFGNRADLVDGQKSETTSETGKSGNLADLQEL